MGDDVGKWVDKRARNNIWFTPPNIVDRVESYFGGRIPLDPATDPSNPTKAVHFFTEEDDGLSQPWRDYGGVFVNPPYSLTPEQKAAGEKPPIRWWIAKVHAEAQSGLPIVALLPCGARFSTGYWQEHALVHELNAACFYRGRPKFIDGRTGKPGHKGTNHDSMIYGFNVDVDRFAAAFNPLGVVFEMRRVRASVLEGFI